MNAQVFVSLLGEARAIAKSLREPILIMQTVEDKKGGRLSTMSGRSELPLASDCYGTVFPDGTYAPPVDGRL